LQAYGKLFLVVVVSECLVLVDGWVCSDAVVFEVVGDDQVCQVEEIEWDEKLDFLKN